VKTLRRTYARPTSDAAALDGGHEPQRSPRGRFVDVRAVVFREGKVLLTKERADGRWTLPGGWADVGSSPGEMAARETLEENAGDGGL
jgi:8-oxo-dGTP pyrophosphatase MutT (NUDIX family)